MTEPKPPTLREALEWLTNLHHGVGRAGDRPVDGEWDDALCAARAALAASEEGATMECGHPPSALGHPDSNPSRPKACLWCGDIADMGMYVENLQTVYGEMTNGLLSKPNTDPLVVIRISQDNQTKDLEDVRAEVLAEFTRCTLSACPDSEHYHKETS